MKTDTHGQRKLKHLLVSYQNLGQDELIGLLGQKAQGLSDDDLDRGNLKSEFSELGKRILNRWSKSLHSMMCGSAEEDAEFRSKFLGAVTGKQALAPIIAGVAVTAFGLSAAMAAILGTLIARHFVNPAADEICQTWAKNLK